MGDSPLGAKDIKKHNFIEILAHLQEPSSPQGILSVLLRRVVNDYGFRWGCVCLIGEGADLVESYPSSRPQEEERFLSLASQYPIDNLYALEAPLAPYLVIPIQARRGSMGFMILEKGETAHEAVVDELKVLGTVAGGAVYRAMRYNRKIRRMGMALRARRAASGALPLGDPRELEDYITRDLNAILGCKRAWLVLSEDLDSDCIPEKVKAVVRRARRSQALCFRGGVIVLPLRWEGVTLGYLALRRDTRSIKDIFPALSAYAGALARHLSEMLPIIARYSGILASPFLGVFQIDREGIITFVNASFVLTLGYPLSALEGFIGKEIWELLPPSHAKVVRETVASLFNGERMMGIHRVEFLDNAGNTLPALMSLSLIRHCQGVLGVSIDLADEEKLLKELEQRNQELQSFAYSAAHELKGPLVYLKKVVSQPSLEGFPIQELRWAVGRLESALKHLTAYSLLDNREVVLESLSPHVIVQEIWSDLAKEVGITMEINIGVPPLMKSDPFLLELVLRNLLSNAQKFGIKGDPPRVDVTCVRMGREYLFSVRDYGEGFEQDRAREIFEPFVRLHPGKKGTGLGLTIAKKAVEKLGGKIWAEGAVGKGATFYFTHPLL